MNTEHITAAVPTVVHRPASPPVADIGLVDVDNIALAGTGALEQRRALDHLDRVAHQLRGVELVYAVASQALVTHLGLWFRYSQWTFRPAEVGPDAADHQLIGYAHCALPQRREPAVVVASGDHIFAELAAVATLQIVVPAEHRGVSAALRPWLRRLPSRSSQSLAA